LPASIYHVLDDVAARLSSPLMQVFLRVCGSALASQRCRPNRRCA
jgi:hypothetical protein